MSVTPLYPLTPPAAGSPAAGSPAAGSPDADAGALHEPCVLLKLGEVVLKGKNRQRFERMLHENIRRAVRDLGIGIRIWQREGVIVLRVTPAGQAGTPEPAGPADTLAAEAAADMVAERMRHGDGPGQGLPRGAGGQGPGRRRGRRRGADRGPDGLVRGPGAPP